MSVLSYGSQARFKVLEFASVAACAGAVDWLTPGRGPAAHTLGLTLTILYFFPSRRLLTPILLFFVLAFADPITWLMAPALGPFSTLSGLPVLFGTARILGWSALSALACGARFLPRSASLALFLGSAIGVGGIAYWNLAVKSELAPKLILFAVTPLFYPFAAILWRSYRGRSYRPIEIACNLASLNAGALPYPLLLTDHFETTPDFPDATERLRDLIRVTGVLCFTQLLLRLMMGTAARDSNGFWGYSLGAFLHHAAPWVPVFRYDFSSFGIGKRIGMVLLEHPAFRIMVSCYFFRTLAYLRFLNIRVGPPIRAPWKATTFYDHMARWVPIYNDVLIQIYIEPAMFALRGWAIRYPAFTASCGIFIGLMLHHAIGSPLGLLFFSLQQFLAAYPALIAYGLLITALLWGSLKWERKLSKKPPSLLRNLGYFLMYIPLAYLVRDYYSVPPSMKLGLFR